MAIAIDPSELIPQWASMRGQISGLAGETLMPAWLKKIVLDIMPSVAATIIGAYVVNYYIIPKSPLGASRAALASPDSKPADARTADRSDEKTDAEKASFEKAVAEKTAIEKTAEKAASDKAAADKAAADKAAADKAKDKSDTATAEPRKPASAPKTAAKTANAATESAPDDRRTINARATDLARAAIERLRGGSHNEAAKAEPAKPDFVKSEPAKPELVRAQEKTQDAPRIQTVSTVATPTIPPMQPLPPAISVASPNADVFEQGNAVPMIRQPSAQATSRSDDRGRFSPPADIPGSRPLDLRAQASAMPADRTSIADDVVSTAKSMFQSVISR